MRARRSESEVRRTLARLRDAAAGSENVMPATVDCVRAYATIGEVTSKLREVFGSYQEPIDIFY